MTRYLLGLALFLIACSGEPPKDEAPVTRSYPTEQRDAAERTLAAARAICGMREERESLVVECNKAIPAGQQLQLATSIANADAVVSGKARTIFFYQPGGTQFAQADRVNGFGSSNRCTPAERSSGGAFQRRKGYRAPPHLQRAL